MRKFITYQICILLYLVTSFLSETTQAQPLLSNNDYITQIQQIGIEDGLLHRSVQTVFEDRNGFIWIGTDKGLQRYDGHDFKTWTKADKTGLLYYISSIGQDDEGWLWLWNNDHLKFVFLHTKTEEILTLEERFGADFSLEPNFDELLSKSNKNPRVITNKEGKLYFGLGDGRLLTYHSQEGVQIIFVSKVQSFFSLSANDNQGNLWGMIDNKDLCKISPQGKILERYLLQEKFNTTAKISPGYFSEWRAETYLPLTIEEGKNQKILLAKIDKNGDLNILQNLGKGLFSILDGINWKTVEEGLNIYDWETKQLLQTLDRGDYNNSLFDNLSPIFMDSKSRYWIYGNLGLNRIFFRPNRFRRYLAFDENNKPFRNATRGIWVEDETILVNCEASHTIQVEKNNPKEWTIFNEEDNARPMLKTKDGNYVLGHPNKIKTVSSSGTVLEEKRINEGNGMWSLYEDARDRLWIGGGTILFYKDATGTLIKKYEPKQGDFGLTMRRGAIQNMIPENENLLWFCSWTGLYLFDTQQEKVLARFASDEKGDRYLPADLFYYLYKDADGVYWIGTSEGLIRWTVDARRWTAKQDSSVDHSPFGHRLFSRRDGLSNDVIYAIFEDKHNRLWMSSDYGIMSFDKTSFDVKTYLPKDGITHHEFNRTSQFQEKDGTIYFGGLNGITAFHPDDFIGDVSTYAKMQISDYEIFDGAEEQLINKVGALRGSNTITFHPDDRFFRLKFVLPTYEDVSKNLYAWKIEGVDKDWNYQKENSLQIGVLPYGTHTLRIKGQSGGGGWSPHELAIKVQVLKPFYLQIWFIALTAFLAIGTVVFFFKRRTYLYKKTQRLLETEITKATAQIAADKKTIELQAEELRQLDKVKSRFFANVSHELRTPLTLMLGPISSVIKSGTLNNKNFTLLKKAQQGGKDLLKLVRSILDLSKMESGKMQLNETPTQLFKFVRRIAAAFESLAQSQDIRFSFNYQAEKFLQLEFDQDKLKTILNNLLSNAIKFTPADGKVAIEVKDLGNHIFIAVADTGRGIHPDDLPNVFNRFYQSNQPDAPTEGGTGIGLALSQEFIKLMGGAIEVESVWEKGSIFSITFPRKETLAAATTIEKLENRGKAVSDSRPEAKPNATTNNAVTILVVEDNPSLRDYLRTILEPHYQVLTAENGKAALDVLHESDAGLPTVDCRLILSDIMMPVMDGYQLLNHIKETDGLRHLPVIMLTARADIQDKLKALRIGVDDYLLKPFEEEELLARIKNLLVNYEQRAALETARDTNATTVKKQKPSISQEDQHWLKDIEIYLKKEYTNPNLSIPDLAAEFAMSERSFQRQLKRLTGITPLQYVQEIRLNEARQLLENRAYNSIAKVAYKVGFQNAKSFSRSFKKRFGKLPSEYI